MKMKKELTILGVIIVILLGYLLFKSSNKVHYKIPELDTVKTEDIDKIEIAKGETTIQLVKKDDKWVISPQGFPTDASKIEKVTGTVSGLTLTELVSKSKSYLRYDLTEEKAIHVKAYNKDKVLRDFRIGKTGATYGHTFVRIDDDPNVYNARESFRSQFDLKVDDLRDKKVMTLDSNEISEITIEQEGKASVFARQVKTTEPPKQETKEGETPPPPPQQPQEEISWVKDDGTKSDKSKVDRLISQLNNLTCQEYIEGKTKEDFAPLTPLYTLKLKGSKDFIITIYSKPEKKEGEESTGGEKYPVLSSESPYPFLLNSWKAEQIMKKPEDLLPETKDDK